MINLFTANLWIYTSNKNLEMNGIIYMAISSDFLLGKIIINATAAFKATD